MACATRSAVSTRSQLDHSRVLRNMANDQDAGGNIWRRQSTVVGGTRHIVHLSAPIRPAEVLATTNAYADASSTRR